MNEKIKKRAALYQLIKMVDENNGSINIRTDKVKRIFNGRDDIVRVEYLTGEIGLLADADFETMNDVILKFQAVNLS